MSRKKQRELAQKAARFFEAKRIAKEAYALADQLLKEIADAVDVGTQIEISQKGKTPKKAVLVDNFAEKQVAYKATGFRRFDLKPVS